MSQSQRIVIFILFLLAILFVSLYFWPLVLNEILTPLALTAWLFLRIFVLSIDQKYYWGALFLGAMVALFWHLLQYSDEEELVSPTETNLTLKDIEFWRSFFTLYSHDNKEQHFIKRELVRIMVSMYASKHGVVANYLVMESLKKREIPLPEQIYTFLFIDDQVQSKRSLLQQIIWVWQAPWRWMDDHSGRKSAEFYRMIDEVLTYMETSMEIKDDDQRYRPNED